MEDPALPSGVAVPSAGTTGPAAPAAGWPVPPPGPPAPERFAAVLATRGLGPRTLALGAVTLAGVAAALLLLDHPGLAGILGLLAVAASEVAAIPAGQPNAPSALALALRAPVDLLLVGGLVAQTAGRQPDVVALLALLVLLLVAWLPLLEHPSPGGGPVGLWRRPDRLGVLLLGSLLGRLVPCLLIAAAVGVLDVWVRLHRLVRPEGPAGPPFLAPLLQPGGALIPAVRFGSLALAVLLLLVLPRSALWRF